MEDNTPSEGGLKTLGQEAYEVRARTLQPWRIICDWIGGGTPNNTCTSARHYAIHNDLPWPINRPKRDNAGRPGYRSFICDHCGQEGWKQIGSLNRARRTGSGQAYCSQKCSAAARRDDNLTPAQRRARKNAYDSRRRALDPDRFRRERRESYYRHHEENLRKQAALRAAIRADPERHEAEKQYKRELAARPEWKEHKRRYDRNYRAERDYGPEWGPVKVALQELQDAVDARSTWNERARAKGTVNKKQSRRRSHEKDQATGKAERGEPQGGAVGHHEGA